jgi:hypothetical protein
LGVTFQNVVPAEELQSSKSRKNLVTIGAAMFNEKPKAGLAFFEENGLIYSDLGPEVSRTLSLARFLKSSSRFDKRLLGDYISKPENIELLKEFIGLFDFKGVYTTSLNPDFTDVNRVPRNLLPRQCEKCSKRSGFLERLNKLVASQKSSPNITLRPNLVRRLLC